ncbi:MAG: nuclease [Citromicrobium sp.]|nr:nuclease [Citromicrobium sp.]|tara:strand:+ start:2890 stop:3231 length:342 start_codon:yes stop_codon:yes gene_type:complete
MLEALALCLPPPEVRQNCIVDGDTLWHGREKIRLADIDAPELAGKCDAERWLAIRARDALLAMLQGGYHIQRTGTDRYGRTLARLTVDGRDVGTVLVSMGLARPWRGRREGWC